MHLLRHYWNLLLGLVVLTAIGVAIVPLTSISPIMNDGAGEEFRDYVYPRLVSLAESVDAVKSMVANHSRNVLALQAHAEKIETLAGQIDDFLASPNYHGDFATVVEHYRDGRSAILTAISRARDALQSFDFAELPELITLFDDGSDQLDLALSLLPRT